MPNINLNNPLEIQSIGLKALEKALGPVGTVRFLQQLCPGEGDYTKERQQEPAMTLEEIDALLRP